MGVNSLQWAAWTSLNTGVVSFSADWDERVAPKLYWGEDRLALSQIRPVLLDAFALHSGYCVKGGLVSFFVAHERTEGFSLEKGLYLAASFNEWGKAIGDPEWALVPSELGGKKGFRLTVPKKALPQDRSSYFKFVTGEGKWLPVPEDAPNFHFDESGTKNYRYSPKRSGRHLFHFRTPLPLAQSEGREIVYECDGKTQSVRISPGLFLKSLKSDEPLGAAVHPDRTVFRIFVPRAAEVHLYLFQDANGPEGKRIKMAMSPSGVWQAVVNGNRHGWFYHYSVVEQEGDEGTSFDANIRIPDPYALAMAGPRGPGIVVDQAVFERKQRPFVPPQWHDLVVVEAHVRDLLAHAPMDLSHEERLGFSGLRRWVESDEFPVTRLGANAIELQPVHEFDTVNREEYAWGYMPMNYFAPASQYCSKPHGLSQIEEFRDLVDAFHKRGLAVILDVVYNHIGEPNFFQYLDKEYYFLLDKEGNYENHSGCGNTFDCNTPMVRRLMRDSLVHWIKAYDVDGFRFDLGELIGKETLAWLEGELKAIKPGVIMVAEPWSFRAHIAKDLRETGIASWNDGYREYIRRYVTLQEDAAGLEWHLKGSHPEWSRFPAQTVNYVDSHDDRCWIDKITENANHDGHRPTAIDRRRTHLMISLLMMSLGIPMLASGVEALKSKGGVNNTYLRGDLNALHYNRYREYSGTVAYFGHWVKFRRGRLGRLLRLPVFPGKAYFECHYSGAVFGMLYNADFSRGTDRLLYLINPTHEDARWHLKEIDFAQLSQLADAECWGDPCLNGPVFLMADQHIVIPPLSCGLFHVKP